MGCCIVVQVGEVRVQIDKLSYPTTFTYLETFLLRLINSLIAAKAMVSVANIPWILGLLSSYSWIIEE